MSEKIPTLKQMYAAQNVPEREKTLFGEEVKGVSENIYGYVTIEDLEAIQSVFNGSPFDVNVFNLLDTKEKWEAADEQLKAFSEWAKMIRRHIEDGYSIMKIKELHHEQAVNFNRYFNSL